MTLEDQAQSCRILRSRAEALAEAWYQVVEARSHAPYPRTEARRILARLAEHEEPVSGTAMSYRDRGRYTSDCRGGGLTIRVFLADDHTVVREGLRAYLDAEPDIEIVGEAGDGREAVERITDIVPDVAVIDIGMPEINGIEATEMIDKLCLKTRVVILSMHSTNEYVFRALQAGASGYVLKESAGRELINAVYAVREGHHYLSQKISDQVIADYVKQRGAAKSQSPLDTLSKREQQILVHLVEGATTREIAASLSLATSTINTYRSRLMRKLNVGDMASLVRFAIQHGLTELE